MKLPCTPDLGKNYLPVVYAPGTHCTSLDLGKNYLVHAPGTHHTRRVFLIGELLWGGIAKQEEKSPSLCRRMADNTPDPHHLSPVGS
eukprot:1161172-Pelagomonas_calceolata.AAC.11